MLLHGNAEGIPPVRRIHRHSLLPLHCSVLIRFLNLGQEGLRAGQVKHVQLLSLIIDAGALQLIPVQRLPAHHVVQLCRKQAAGNLAALPLIIPGDAPADSVPGSFAAGADYQLFGSRVHQHLHIDHLLQPGDAGVVEYDAVSFNGQGWIKAMREEFPSHHLVPVKGEACLQGNPGGFLTLLLTQRLEARGCHLLRLIQHRRGHRAGKGLRMHVGHRLGLLIGSLHLSVLVIGSAIIHDNSSILSLEYGCLGICCITSIACRPGARPACGIFPEHNQSGRYHRPGKAVGKNPA